MGENDRARIGDFELIEKIGEGALGTVFKAVCRVDCSSDLLAGQVVAVKKLHPAADRVREVEALRALSHPHIVRFHAGVIDRPGEWDEAACLITEFLDGEDLAKRLARSPYGLPWEEASRILLATLDALAYAESRGVLHRDLKPSNLFLCRDGSVKVIDFGLARRTGGAFSLAEGSRSVGGLTGTLDFMAPEFARMDGFRGDTRSDLFSFGCLAWHTVTGRLPYPELGEHPEIGFIRRWTGTPTPQAALPRPIAYGWEGLSAFFARCLHVDRDARFPSFREAREALVAIRPRVLAGGEEPYTLTAFLASGGFCDVFRARGDRSRREVAVKRLHAGRHAWRFRREAGLMEDLRQLAHPALVKVFELVEEEGPDGRPCLVMEYLPGEDLRRRLNGARESGRGLPAGETIRLFIRYLDGLEALHRHGIVHRDIKPANLYAPAGRPDEARLLDLGIACEKDGTVSMRGLPPGTLDYMAPELACVPGARGSPQSDLFALGCSLFESLTGRLPLKRLPREDAPALRALCARSESESAFRDAFENGDDSVFLDNPGLAEIVVRALRYDPSHRYGGREEAGTGWTGAGAREMRLALQALFEAPPASKPEPPPGDMSNEGPAPTSDATLTLDAIPLPGRSKTAAMVVALVVLSGVFVFFNLPRSPAPEPAPSPPVPASVVLEAPVVALAPVVTPAPAVEPQLAPATVPEPVFEPSPEPPRKVILPPSVSTPAVAVPVVPVPVESPAAASVSAAEAWPEPEIPPWDRARLEPLLDRTEAAIGERRRWLYQVADPLRAATLRRYEPAGQPPAWDGALPYLLAAERRALSPELRDRFERALLWEQAVSRSGGDAMDGRLADALEELATRAGSGMAEACRFESLLVRWNGREIPDPAALPPLAEARYWRAHALAAHGDDQDARDVLADLAEAVAEGGAIRVEDALLAVRAADQCWDRMVRDIRERTSPEIVAPGVGRAERNPVAAYTQAVARVRSLAAADAERLLAVARATGAETAVALARRIESGAARAALGDFGWALPNLAQTPWREAQAAWTGRQKLGVDERAILNHIWGLAPLPTHAAEIPVARLRESP